MSEQELNSKMEFIVEQQAKFSIDIEKLKEAQEELTKKHNNLTDALTTVVGVVGKLAQAQENLTINQEKHSKYCSPKVC